MTLNLKKHAWFLPFLGVLLSLGCDSLAMAPGTPKIMLAPTSLTIEGRDRSADLTIINNGSGKGSYRIDVVSMRMQEDGPLVENKEGDPAPYSAVELFRVSPKRITLPPGSNQKVRLLLRLPPDLADGEYRAHLRVRAINATEPDDGKAPPDLNLENDDRGALSISVEPEFSVMIPVIIRHGQTTYRAEIQDIVRGKDYTGRDSINIRIGREGNRSAIGSLTVNYIDSNGHSYKVAHMVSAVIYRDIPQRVFRAPLRLPEGLTGIGSGKLQVIYRERIPGKNGEKSTEGSVIAEAELAI